MVNLGISPFWIPARMYYNDTVEQVLDGFPDPLAPTEPGKIAQIVNAMVASGNWANMKAWVLNCLESENNSVWDWIRQLAMIPVNDPTFSNTGILYDGVDQYLGSLLIPSTSGLLQDDILISAYCHTNNDQATNALNLFGVNSAAFTNRLVLLQNTSSTRLRGAVNADAVLNYTGDTFFADNARYSIGRDEAVNQEIFKNGSQVATAGVPSTGLSENEMYIAVLNNNGVNSGFFSGIISYFRAMNSPNLAAANSEGNLVQSLFNLN